MASPSAVSGTDATEPVLNRVESIDLVRGAVMVLMVLDHCRDFFGNARINPTDLSITTPVLFFTRWVTHFCAPTFSLLAGVSAALWGARRTRGELARHLVIRGLWLIVLEQTWENVFIFNVPSLLLGLVLWALGWSMIVLAGLVYLPRPVIGGLALVLIAGHNLLDPISPTGGVPALAWSFLHRPGMQVLPGGVPILLGYPLIPWVGVMAAGYALGPLFAQPARVRRVVLLSLGVGATVAFVLLRWLNVYGDPQPWSVHKNHLFTLMSFLNCTKQPPSLLFLLMTLGPALLMLAAVDHGLGAMGRPFRRIGRVPLFFYLLQWPVAHALAVVLEAIQGHPIGWMFRFPPFESPPGYGENLAVVYLAWLVTVALLYYPSCWYDDWRRKRRARDRAALPASAS